jgi:hypothetical protein
VTEIRAKSVINQESRIRLSSSQQIHSGIGFLDYSIRRVIKSNIRPFLISFASSISIPDSNHLLCYVPSRDILHGSRERLEKVLFDTSARFRIYKYLFGEMEHFKGVLDSLYGSYC